MTAFTDYILSAEPNDVYLETLQLSHPSWSQTYRIIRNDCLGRTLTTESGTFPFVYYPVEIKFSPDKTDLDKTLSFVVGDLGEIIPSEVLRMQEADTMTTKPVLTYRGYSSESNSMVYGPVTFDVKGLSVISEGARIDAGAPSVNSSRTGRKATVETIATLKGFL